jgi:hypothetical protein
MKPGDKVTYLDHDGTTRKGTYFRTIKGCYETIYLVDERTQGMRAFLSEKVTSLEEDAETS